MYVSFNELPQSARVWVYQANRTLTASEKEAISNYLTKATNQWAAHGAPLKSSFTITEDRFVIIAADEAFNAASGCSIDKSTHFIQSLEREYGVDMFDRMNFTVPVHHYTLTEAEAFIRKLHPDWRGDIPLNLVFRNDGTFVKALGMTDPQEVTMVMHHDQTFRD